MLSNGFSENISNDWLWRERELRELDSNLLRDGRITSLKSSILIAYAHWEGHFKVASLELLSFLDEGIRRKVFKWTDVKSEVRHRILFCGYRRSSLSGQTHETFISYLNALSDNRYSGVLKAKDEIIMIDDNLNSTRAEAICRNLGVEYSWCALKKVIIDERLLEYRNTIAHGSQRLRSGDELNITKTQAEEILGEAKNLIREAKNRFQNAIDKKEFLA